MGAIHKDSLERAARYLIQVLNEHGGRVHFNYFYDATEVPFLKLRRGIGATEEEGYWDCAELVLEVAAAELERQGYLVRIDLDEELADGLPAYVIELTEPGRQKFASGQWPWFRHVEV